MKTTPCCHENADMWFDFDAKEEKTTWRGAPSADCSQVIDAESVAPVRQRCDIRVQKWCHHGTTA